MLRPAVLLLVLLFAGCASPALVRTPAPAQATGAAIVPATDARIRVMGRHLVDGETVRFAASGVTFFARFRGTEVAARIEMTSADTTAHDWFTAVVDGGAPVRFKVERGTARYVLASGLARGIHTLELSKATEGQNGHDRLVSLEATEILAANLLPARTIEFIGDSITCGFGADPTPVACGAGTWYDATHATIAYGPRVARAVSAQWMLSAVSGIGMIRNWNTDGPTMPDVYDGVFMEYEPSPAWDPAGYRPDLVVVTLGTNDFSKGESGDRPAPDGAAFVSTYTRFAARLRARYPDARLMLANSPMLGADDRAVLGGYLEQVVAARAAAGDAAVSTFSFPTQYNAGCGGHPSMAEQAQMAVALEPAIRAAMGW